MHQAPEQQQRQRSHVILLTYIDRINVSMMTMLLGSERVEHLDGFEDFEVHEDLMHFCLQALT